MALRNFSSIILKDGRKLAFREYGQGFPIVFLHGNLNSRLFAPSWGKTEEDTLAAGCRVIALDRPGYGDSCFQPDRKYADTAADVTELLDHLQLPQAAILGYSSGGPNAMACAAHMNPSRIAALGLLSSDGPYATMPPSVLPQMFSLTEEEQQELKQQEKEGRGRQLTPQMTLTRAEHNYSDLHSAFSSLSKPERRELALADLEHAACQGLDKGPAQDAILESSEWDFTLQQVQAALSPSSSSEGDSDGDGLSLPPPASAPSCVLWHGTEDTDVPPLVAEYLAAHLPAARVQIIEGESHSMIRRRWRDFLSALVGVANTNTTNS